MMLFEDVYCHWSLVCLPHVEAGKWGHSICQTLPVSVCTLTILNVSAFEDSLNSSPKLPTGLDILLALSKQSPELTTWLDTFSAQASGTSRLPGLVQALGKLEGVVDC